MLSAKEYAKRATSDILIGPDWSINLELCDAVNSKPHELKEALKVLKKRLGAKVSNTQILALVALETLAKNCGTIVFKEIVEREILIEMVKIVKTTQSLNVKEKILSLINAWKSASGGQRIVYSQYEYAYNDLILQGFNFPPPEESSALYQDEKASQNLHQSEASALSLDDMKHAEGVVSVLSEMLNALDLRDPEIKQELIVDLVETCRSYQKCVAESANVTTDERLLGMKLTLNDNLQRVIQRYEGIAEGNSDATTASVSLLDVGGNSSDDLPPVDLNSLKSENTSRSYVLPRIPPPPPKQSKIADSDNFSGLDQSWSEEISVPVAASSKMKEVEDSDNFVDLRQFLSEEISAPPAASSNMKVVEDSDNVVDLRQSMSEDILIPPATPPSDGFSKLKEVEVMENEKEASSSGKKATDRLFDELMEEFWKLKK